MTSENLLMVEDCEARESRLTDWEREFIESIRRRLESGHGLTDKQQDTLDKIWNRATAKG
jgi:predicted small metal-binding protein